MIFSGLFTDLDAAETVAVISCLFEMEKASDTASVSPQFAPLLSQIHTMARSIAAVCADCKMPINAEKYVQNIKPYLMKVALAWCRGSSFTEISAMTDLFEGSIIRYVYGHKQFLELSCIESAAHGALCHILSVRACMYVRVFQHFPPNERALASAGDRSQVYWQHGDGAALRRGLEAVTTRHHLCG